jgi:hypothetical protein
MLEEWGVLEPLLQEYSSLDGHLLWEWLDPWALYNVNINVGQISQITLGII